jgi:hypothetical protein
MMVFLPTLLLMLNVWVDTSVSLNQYSSAFVVTFSPPIQVSIDEAVFINFLLAS